MKKNTPKTRFSSDWLKSLKKVLCVVAIAAALFGGSDVFAQPVKQPADPPLWNGAPNNLPQPYTGPKYKYNDSIQSMGADRLHAIGITGQGVSAAIVDAGFFTDHEIFAGNKIVNDYVGYENTHGTHVSGIVLSMAPDSRIWLGNNSEDDNQNVTDQENSQVFKQIGAAAGKYNIVAVNNSWGDPIEGLYSKSEDIVAEYPLTAAAVKQLFDSNIVVIASSGNAGVNDHMSYMDGLPMVLSVGALNKYGYIADFSTQYQKGDYFLLAPGSGIFSAFDTSEGESFYRNDTGTSMASPHVTGAVTLLASGARNATATEIIDSLYDSAIRIPFNGGTVVKKMYSDGRNPNATKDMLIASFDPDAVRKYTDWLDAVAVKYANDTVTADEWRLIDHIFDMAYRIDDTNEFLDAMARSGDLATLKFTDYRFLQVDRAYMNLTEKRTHGIADRIEGIDSNYGSVMDAFAGELGGRLDRETADIFQRLDNFSTETQADIARQMSPAFLNSTVDSAHLGLVGLHRALGRRTEINRIGEGRNAKCSPCTPCDAACGSSNATTSVWIEGFGDYSSYDGTRNNSAYNGHFSGMSFGVERSRKNYTVGVFGAYGDHLVKGEGRSTGNWGNVGIYGRLDRAKGFLEGSVAYGYGDYDLIRSIYIPGTSFSDNVPGQNINLGEILKFADASTKANGFSTRIAAGRDLWKRKGWRVGPRAEFSLSYLDYDGYDENGAGALNLHVDRYKTTYLEGGIGLHAAKKFVRGSQMFIASGKVLGMYGGTTGDDLSGRFLRGDNAFTADPNHLATGWIAPEATLAWNMRDGVVLSGSYYGRFGHNYSSNAVSAALNLYW